MIARAALALLPFALLTACGGGDNTAGGSASGKVLEGTISDEMLPLDTIRAEAPLAGPAADGTSKQGAAAGKDSKPGAQGDGGESNAPAEASSGGPASAPADPIGDAANDGE